MVKNMEKQLMLRIAADVFSHLYAAQTELEEPQRADFAGVAERLRQARAIIGRRCGLNSPPIAAERSTGISRASILLQVREDVVRLGQFMETTLVSNGQLPPGSGNVFKAIAIDLDNLLASEPLASAGRKEDSRG